MSAPVKRLLFSARLNTAKNFFHWKSEKFNQYAVPLTSVDNVRKGEHVSCSYRNMFLYIFLIIRKKLLILFNKIDVIGGKSLVNPRLNIYISQFN